MKVGDVKVGDLFSRSGESTLALVLKINNADSLFTGWLPELTICYFRLNRPPRIENYPGGTFLFYHKAVSTA